MDLRRYLDENEGKIKKFETFFREEDGRALTSYSRYSAHLECSTQKTSLLPKTKLETIIKTRLAIATNVYAEVKKYCELTGEEMPFYARRFFSTNRRIITSLNAELACREYFNHRNNSKRNNN